MPTLNCFVSKEHAEENSSSPKSKSAEKNVLPPFSVELNVDEKLKLSNSEFKQTIYDSFRDKNITPLSQLKATSGFPTPHVLAQFASKAYTDYNKRETDAHYETRLGLPDGWKLLTTASNGSKTSGYFGAACWHPEHQHVVIAHRGTVPTSFGALWTDVVGVLFKYHVPQMSSASTFAYNVVEVLKLINQEKGVQFQVFFTGHSLGGWLAQITNFTTKYLDRKGITFLKSQNGSQWFHPHTVVFDSPGCKDMLSHMAEELDVLYYERSIDLEHLDITSYLSAPNRINTCNLHMGAVYRIFPDFSDMGWWGKNTALYKLETHSMDKIVEAFDPETGQVHVDEQGQLKIQVVLDWPVTAGLSGGKKYRSFFKWAKHFNNYHPQIADETLPLKGYHPLRYQTKTYDERVTSVSKFSYDERQFLENYCQLCQLPKFFMPKELFSALEDDQAQEVKKMLQSFEIKKQTIRCEDGSALQNMIPYVQFLLQLFPEIKENTKCALSLNEIGNNVYQIGTKHYLEKFQQSPLEFKADDLTLRDFLNSDQEKVLQVRMVDGDAWTGLIKIYQVLEKTDRLCEGNYTLLTLEHLLLVNRMVNLSTLLESTTAPHLLLVMCETRYLLNDETRQILRSLFDTLKEVQSVKIILTTQSEDDTVIFLQDLAKETVGNGFITRDEQLTWSDLTTITQEKLLEKTVKFQSAGISLKEIMSAESAAAKFLPLYALLEEKELTIADPLPISNGYNESYYIGRTLRHQKTIKQDIFNDQYVKDSHVYLARTEEEYTSLCQLHPKGNVHWVEKDKSGNFIWQHSQGSLEALRRYIDTKSSQKYTADDLDMLLEQAQHQRLMLISDTAGMGKSTVLTHLSQKIKQKFPGKWVVRVDLNDHTDALNALKQEKIDKENVMEFVTKKVLKLKPGLEMELFKQCCEQKQEIRTVIMLDGVDEISPFYKETVIDLLQVLSQTALEQLWVTTRPHLREELKDKLQQLSYTLEPFSEENQVEFLTKFWRRKNWFTESKGKEGEVEKDNLEIYAKHLIKELAQSISDKDGKFTGIPLQARMLAEVFDKEVKIFYQSAESKPSAEFQVDLLELYARFIDRKYDIYKEEKLQITVSKVAAIQQREREIRQMSKDLQLLAFKVLFPEEQVTLFQTNTERFLSNEELTQIGIVQISHDGKPHFIHRTFAEYCVADCLVKSLIEGNNTSGQVLDFTLKHIILEPFYRVIRDFINCFLSKSKPSIEMLKQHGNRIHNLWSYSKIELRELLHRTVREGKVNILGFLLDSLQAAEHTDTEEKLLLAKDIMSQTAWHQAVISCNIQVLEKLWECAERNPRAHDLINKLLLAKEIRGMNAFQLAVNKGTLEVLLKQWKLAKENLTKEEVNNLLLATDQEGRTVFHMAAGYLKLEVFQGIFNLANENLRREEVNNLLLAKDDDGLSFLHMGAKYLKLEVCQGIFNLAKENLTREEVNKLLLTKDYGGFTFLHVAALMGEQEACQGIFNWAKGNLTREEVNKLLLAKNNDGWTFLHVAAKGGKQEVCQGILNCAKENLTREEVNKLLLAIDNDGWTFLHVAAKYAKQEVCQGIFNWAKENLTREEVNKLLATDNEGRTFFHMAADLCELEVLK